MDTHCIAATPLARLVPYIGDERVDSAQRELSALVTALAGRRLVVVTGDDRRKGGVYELLRSLLPYLAGVGINVVWTNIDTHPDARPALEYFHVLAHGHAPSARWEQDVTVHRRQLRAFGAAGAQQLIPDLAPTDVIFAHDTQTVLSAAMLKERGWPVVWHSHVGSGLHNKVSASYWQLFGKALGGVNRCIFYLPSYVPDALRHNAICALPSVDPSTAKNALMPTTTARGVLRAQAPTAAMTGLANTITAKSLVAVQVSRWDPLKDMPGVAEGFRRAAEGCADFHGMLVGTVAQSANEQIELSACLKVVQAAEPTIADRLHVWSVPASGTVEHDNIISAVQNAADIIVQKSVQEGFGLTVTEAMLKAKPVVATAVGGIPTQIQHNYNGVLLDDGTDLDALASAVLGLAADPARRTQLGTAAASDARRRFSCDVQLRVLASALVAAL